MFSSLPAGGIGYLISPSLSEGTFANCSLSAPERGWIETGSKNSAFSQRVTAWEELPSASGSLVEKK